MLFLDWIYIIIYWSIGQRQNPERTSIWVLNYLLFPALSGFLVFFTSILASLLKIKISLAIIIFIGIFGSFFLSEWLVDLYYSKNKQIEIITKRAKPGLYRYLLFICIILFALFTMVAFFILSGIVLHNL